MKKKVPKISEAEWEVMQVAWQKDPVTAQDVIQMLGTRWSPRTVKTLLSRLVAKGALRYEARGKAYLYRPAVAREDCVRQESQSFLKRVFGGEEAPLLVHFVEKATLTPEELAHLRRILAEKGK